MNQFKARILAPSLLLSFAFLGLGGSVARAQDLWAHLDLTAVAGFPSTDTLSFEIAGNAWVQDQAKFGTITAFKVTRPNGGAPLEGLATSADGRIATTYARFTDLNSIPAGNYTMTITGSVAGTRTYILGINPASLPGPVSTQFVSTTKALLSASKLSGTTVRLDGAPSYADRADYSLRTSSQSLYAETRQYVGGTTYVTLPLNLLAPGQIASFTAEYQNTIFGPDFVNVYYNTSYTVTFAAASAPQIVPRFANISARGYCSGGDRVMIGGFVVGGNTAKRVLVRALGPTLTSQGIGQSEVLLDPMIQVYKETTVIAANDNWSDNAKVADITSTSGKVGAGSLTATDSSSSALLLTLAPGVYSFVASGKLGTAGIVLLEVFDADDDPTSGRLVNISTRGYSAPGNGVTIGGFVISGSGPKQVLLRAVGPTLTKLGISAADVMADPTLELHDASHGNVIFATNDNWTDGNAEAIASAAKRLGANAFDATDVKSSALLAVLLPGAYSFVAAGKNGANGVVLVEIYDAD